MKEELETRFWMHKSNDEPRWWWHYGHYCFHIELGHPKFSIRFSVEDDGEDTFAGSFCGLYWSLDAYPLRRYWPFRDGEFSFYWHDCGLWLIPWGHPMGDSSWNDPWWKRGWHIDFPDLLLGKVIYSKVEGERFENVVIPMPERNFLATMTFETCTWKRPRWFARVRKYTNIQLDQDAPKFPGKGESDWDQGDDSIQGMSTEGHSIPKAIGGYVKSVMEYRAKRNGIKSLIQGHSK